MDDKIQLDSLFKLLQFVSNNSVQPGTPEYEIINAIQHVIGYDIFTRSNRKNTTNVELKYMNSVNLNTGQPTPISIESFVRYNRICEIDDDLKTIKADILATEAKLNRLRDAEKTATRLKGEASDLFAFKKHCDENYQDAIFDFEMRKKG